MDYQNREEFYALVQRQQGEIKSLDIPEDERAKRLFVINEAVARYEEMIKDIQKRDKALGRMEEGINRITDAFAVIDKCIGQLGKVNNIMQRFAGDYGMSRNPDRN